ncbi:MAG: 3-deoxy-7-phosphoheptulonate synthase class II [Bryobacteraceae bacterium]|nr:3-deoxy-7-phosphoheptulonate synthase class II [Bryobacteraceae bacterium]
MNWSPQSWRALPALQQPTYDDAPALEQVVDEIRSLPPLVTGWEIEQLKHLIAEAAAGKRFLLQGGDCAETFSDCRASVITNKLKVLLQMSLVLVQGAQQPVIRVGRFAGQYAKPRSDDFETRDGVTLPSYRGDIVNRPNFSAADRRPDPQLLLRGYERAALTLNLIRALSEGGFADLHHPEYWDLDFVEHSPFSSDYRRIVDSIRESLHFMENVLGVNPGEIRKVDFYSSHEGLHLHYEEAQTRFEGRTQRWYNLSTHLPWIGLRTSDPAGAHVEYFRGIANPVAVKVGPGTTRDRLERLLEVLNPANEPGRLTLIHRLGAAKIEENLARLIEIVQRSGRQVLWVCDPMHGNTMVTSDGLKTRPFADILSELERAFDLHALCGSRLGGVHIELTGENVTECIGGARGLTEADLKMRYLTEVDPRLNGEQALEMALLIAQKMKRIGG